MTWALRDAGIAPTDVQYVNAHATSTPVGDEIEALAVKGVFGSGRDDFLVSSTESMTGHLLGASGALEFAVVVPFLVFLFIIALDWARIFYFSIIVNNCARNGAMFAVDPYATAKSPYANITAAALADATDCAALPGSAQLAGIIGFLVGGFRLIGNFV